MDLKSALSLAGTAGAIIASVAPIPNLIANGKKRNFDMIPVNFLYLIHATQILWLVYSVLIDDFGLILVNLMTVLLTGVCLMLYLYYKQALVTALPAYLVTVIASFMILPRMLQSSLLGSIASLISISSTLSGLSKVKLVLDTKEKSYIDINMTIAGIVNSGIWLAYGILIQDMPNILSNLVNFGCYVLYGAVFAWAATQKKRSE